MKVTEITVSAGRTFNHPYEDYSNLRPQVTMRSTVEEGEDPIAATKTLQAMAEKSVEDHKQALLDSLHKLHYLSESQRELTSLGEQMKRSQARIDALRKECPQPSLPGSDEIEQDNDRTSRCENLEVDSHGTAL